MNTRNYYEDTELKLSIRKSFQSVTLGSTKVDKDRASTSTKKYRAPKNEYEELPVVITKQAQRTTLKIVLLVLQTR